VFRRPVQVPIGIWTGRHRFSPFLADASLATDVRLAVILGPTLSS